MTSQKVQQQLGSGCQASLTLMRAQGPPLALSLELLSMQHNVCLQDASLIVLWLFDFSYKSQSKTSLLYARLYIPGPTELKQLAAVLSRQQRV